MSLEDRLYDLVGAYESLPGQLKSSMGWSYRHLPARVRLGSRYGEFCHLAEDVVGWSAAEVREYQTAELRRVLNHASKHSPYYAQAFAAAGFRPEQLDDPTYLARCPTTDKSDLVRHGASMVCDRPSPSKRLRITTGGSTGTPVGIYLHRGVSRPKEQAFLEALWSRAGFRPGDRLAVIRGHVTSARSDGRIAAYDGTRPRLILSSYHLSEQRLSEYLDEIARFQPSVLHAYPSAALLLAEMLSRTGAEWPVQLKCLLASSERLTAPQRRLLEETFRCRVYHWYGHSERVVLAGEGRQPGRLYFFPTYGYVEFGPPDALGLREVIGTSFHNLVMPLIRYRTGDYVKVVSSPDEAQSEYPWPQVESVNGRDQEFLLTAKGRRISLTAINMHDDTFDDLYAVQFYQCEPGRAELRYVPGPRFDPRRLARIRAAMDLKAGDDIEIVLREVSDVEKTQRGKGRWLVSDLSKPGQALEPL